MGDDAKRLFHPGNPVGRGRLGCTLCDNRRVVDPRTLTQIGVQRGSVAPGRQHVQKSQRGLAQGDGIGHELLSDHGGTGTRQRLTLHKALSHLRVERQAAVVTGDALVVIVGKIRGRTTVKRMTGKSLRPNLSGIQVGTISGELIYPGLKSTKAAVVLRGDGLPDQSVQLRCLVVDLAATGSQLCVIQFSILSVQCVNA